MNMGGLQQTTETLRALRMINVLIAPTLSMYALLVICGVLPGQQTVDPLWTAVIVYAWLLIGLYYYFRPTQTRRDTALRLGVLHLLACSLSIAAVGFAQPFVVVFIVLFVESYLYFGQRGLYASSITFIAASFVDILLWDSTQSTQIVQTLMALLAVLCFGLVFVRIIAAQETDHRTLARSQAGERLQYNRMLTIMNNLSDAAFATDEHGKIILYNAACLNLLDTNDDLRGKNIGSLFKLQTTDQHPASLVSLLQTATRTTVRDDLTHAYSDGETIRLEITFSPIRSSFVPGKESGDQAGYIVLMRDVTKQKSLEEQRDEFISVVSHELRTPITIVEGTLSNLNVILTQPKAPEPKVLADSVKTAHDQVLYLARMVNDLSTLSRAERGVADAPELIDVAELLQAMHHQYEHDAEARHLQLNLELGTKLGTVNVSRLYLEELLQNFITNGIKYTKEGSVTIIAKRVKDTVTFAVKDTGIGISRSDQQKVFQKFYRSEDYRIRETNGTGLGLYVASKLAHKLQTTITLESHLNHGSTFSFTLPVEESHI